MIVIVVDTDVLAYLYMPGPFNDAAEALLLRDAEWAVPQLWRSEFRTGVGLKRRSSSV